MEKEKVSKCVELYMDLDSEEQDLFWDEVDKQEELINYRNITKYLKQFKDCSPEDKQIVVEDLKRLCLMEGE